MRFEGREFKGEKVRLDDNEFIDCTFTDCNLQFAGGAYMWVRCRVAGTFGLGLADHAGNTLLLLQMLSAHHPSLRSYVIGLLNPNNVNEVVEKRG